MKYASIVREHFSKQAVFSIRDLSIFLSTKGISKGYVRLFLHNLLKKGEIVRISKGIYSFEKDPVLWGFAFSPFYYGLQQALSLHGLWEQESIPVIITPRKVRTGLREICGSNILVRRIGRKMFFGFEMLPYYGQFIPVSCPEKTLLDFFYFREPLPESALKELLKKADGKKLNAFLKKYPKRFRHSFRKKFPVFFEKAGKEKK
ncbi:MAG: type IV toxin-antitoxin system AbiEi family antitoxin domain-containing protein [Candidatus Diapherotrites archaeon]|nr:type IV toxin-antitoxin system AbiEi family antitoxin domain-containing protein [Candidatus Diapherotrites archaeon]